MSGVSGVAVKAPPSQTHRGPTAAHADASASSYCTVRCAAAATEAVCAAPVRTPPVSVTPRVVRHSLLSTHTGSAGPPRSPAHSDATSGTEPSRIVAVGQVRPI